MFDWLFQPFPYQSDLPKQIKSNVLGGVVVFLVIYLMRPFGTDVPEGYEMSYALGCLGFGVVTFVTASLFNILSAMVLGNVDESKWVVWKNIASTLILIIMIGIANWIYSSFIYKTSLSWEAFLTWQYMTFIIGIVPTMLGYFLYQRNLLNKYEGGAHQLNQGIAPQGSDFSSFEEIQLIGDNQNESLSLKTNNLLYIESANNYAEVIHYKNGTIEKALIRSTLKKLETQLATHPQFFRCHKTYITNLNLVEKISGNAQGYKLHLKETDIQIPVSRSLNEEISRRFSKEK